MPTITCPQCNARGNVPDSFAGKVVRCRHCKGNITVPPSVRHEPSMTFTEVTEEPAELKQAPPSATCPYCLLNGDLPVSLASKTIRCPGCGRAFGIPEAGLLGKPIVFEEVPEPPPSRHWRKAPSTEEVASPVKISARQQKVREGELMAEGCASFFLKIAVFIALCFLAIIILVGFSGR